MLNLTKKYIKNPNAFAGSLDVITVYEHKNGEQVVIDFADFMSEHDNHVTVHFSSGRSASVEVKDYLFKLGTNDDFRQRDFSEHSCVKRNPHLLLKIYIRHMMGRYLRDNELEALHDIVAETIHF